MTGRPGRRLLLAALTAAVVALAASLLTGGRLGGWPLAVAVAGLLPFLLMAWGVGPVGAAGGGVRAVVLAIGAFWVTGCLATVFVLAGRESTWWTPYGLPTQLAVLLLLLAVAPLLLLGLVHALTFEDEPDAEPSSGEDGGHAQGG